MVELPDMLALDCPGRTIPSLQTRQPGIHSKTLVFSECRRIGRDRLCWSIESRHRPAPPNRPRHRALSPQHPSALQTVRWRDSAPWSSRRCVGCFLRADSTSMHLRLDPSVRLGIGVEISATFHFALSLTSDIQLRLTWWCASWREG